VAPDDFGNFFAGLLVLSAFVLPVSYITLVLLGLPLVNFLNDMESFSFWSCTLGAIPIGAAANLIMHLIGWGAGHVMSSTALELVSTLGVRGVVGFLLPQRFALLQA
jgi:hypothetical protein